MYDHIVIGAGIQGSSTAYNLAKNGKKTLLLDQFPLPHSRGSSLGHSRIIRQAYPAHHRHYTPLVGRALALWRRLEEESGKHVFSIGTSADVKTMEDSLKGSKLSYTKLSNSQLKKDYPMFNVDPALEAVVEQEAGVIHADKALYAYWESFVKAGGTIRDGDKVTAIVPGHTVTVKTSTHSYQCRSAVICSGAWSRGLLKPLNVNLPLTPHVVSVFYWKDKETHGGKFPALPTRFINAIDGKHNLYSVPALEYPNLVKLCLHSGTEGDPDSRDVTMEPWDMKIVSQFIDNHIPCLENRPSIVERCFYTWTPDAEYILDMHPQHRNIVMGAGFSGHGFKLAPVVGEILCDLAMRQNTDYDISHFKLTRFTGQSKL